jgi:hypothetical protein
MNTSIKLAVAGALLLGGYAATAQDSEEYVGDLSKVIANPSTGASTVLLFAEVLKGNTVVASYGANTGITIAAAYAGTVATFKADANLSKLFAADAAGDTLVWAVEGSQYKGPNNSHQYIAGNTEIVTTSGNPLQIPTRPGGVITGMNNALSNAITTLNANITAHGNGTDVEGASPATAGVWDASSNNNISDWGGIESAIVGLKTVDLYDITGTGSLTKKLKTVTKGKVTLSKTGLVFAK